MRDGSRRIGVRALVVGAVVALAATMTWADPAPAQPGGVDPGLFVERSYQELLGRAPEAEGREYWTGLLEDGEPPRAVLAWIGNSPEHRRHMVTDSYDRILRRAPDDDGLSWWADALGDTLTLTGLQASLFASPEYGDRFGEDTTEGFVRAVYDDVLDREPEDDGLRYWTDLLDGGTDRQAVATAVLESPEALLQPELSVVDASPERREVTTGLGTITVRVDTDLVAEASNVRVAVAGEPLGGEVSAGDTADTLVFRARQFPTWVDPGSTVPVIVTVLGYDGQTVGRADYHFHYRVPSVQTIGSFTTPLVPGQPRNANIRLAADYIDGDTIPSGSTYSLNQGIGQRTSARGFQMNGYIDEDGDVISVTGGGVSQMGTTFLNAAWSAGIQIDDFRPHTIWFERYPMCREATLAWNQLDVVVTNDTPYAITIATTHTSSSVTVSLVGVPWAEVSSWIGEPFNTGSVGGPFSVRCGRTVTYPDGSTADESWSWRYNEGYPG